MITHHEVGAQPMSDSAKEEALLSKSHTPNKGELEV